jgi:5-methylcytosine-specific restriction endonuclease McrA
MPAALADRLLENQARMDVGQQTMAKGMRGLVWVLPRARKRIPARIRAMIYERDGGVCAYCAVALPIKGFALDHIYPWSAGGSDNPENLTLSCKPCNSSKKDKFL